MSKVLTNTHTALLKYLDHPEESILHDIIQQLKQSKTDTSSFISLFEQLLSSPEEELDIISRLDMLYEEENARDTAQDSEQEKKGIPLGEEALDLLDDFVEEANEQLVIIVDSLLAVESNPKQAVEQINHAFRAMHTIKGSAGFLALKDIITVAHEAETILGQAREAGTIQEETISWLLNITQAIEDAIVQMQKNRIIPTLNTKAILHPLPHHATKTVLEPISPMRSPSQMEIFRPKDAQLSKESIDMLDDFVEEAHELLSNFFYLLKMGLKEPLEQEREEVFRYIHNLRTNAQAIGLSVLSNLAQAAEDLLSQKQGPIEEEHRFALLSIQDGIERVLHNLSQHQREGEESNTDIVQRLKKLHASQPKISIPTTLPPKPSSPKHSLRVPIESLNRIMNLSTELVVVKNRLQGLMEYHPSQIEPLYQQLKTISRELQDEVESTRLQPIAIAFRKVPKIVREASRITNKKVEVLFEGEKLGLDKSLLDQLQEPILHLTRNAIDHGIEAPKEREMRQKNKSGVLLLQASVKGGMFCLKIQDDGAGVDVEKLCLKAQKKGLYTEQEIQELSSQQKQNLLFHPGLSSKDGVTSLSGRGMGMDIVKKNIEKLRGSIQIQSKLGIGTAVIIQVPLSVRVMQTLLIHTKETPILIPQLRIQEVRSIDPLDISILEDKRYYTFGNDLLPCIPLSTLLAQIPEENKKIIICTHGDQRFGIETAHIHGFQEVVSHSLPPFLNQVHLYQGTSILENGTPALILNLDHIFHAYELFGYHKRTRAFVSKKKIAYVIFRCSSLIAVPLKEVLHVSKITSSKLSQCSGWSIFQYDQGSFPIIEISDVIPTKENQSYLHNFILLFSNQSNIGIPVSSIVGIFHSEQHIQSTMKRKGVHGTIRYHNQDVEVLDINVFYQSIIESNVSV